MKVMILPFLFLHLGFSLNLDLEILAEFSLFKQKFAKSYSPSEEPLKFQVFRENFNYIFSMNQRSLPFKLGIGPFADLSYSEFSSLYLRAKTSQTPEFNAHVLLLDTDFMPSSINWQELQKVGPVKNQGNCGDCYIFASVAALESIRAINYMTDVLPLSEQQILDCDRTDEDEGCRGGEGYMVFDYMDKVDCIASEEAYPYKAKQEGCRKSIYKTDCTDGFVDDWKAVVPNNEYQLMAAVANQPVNTAIHVGQALQHYKSGVMTSDWCSQSNQTNHEVLIFGFGSDDDTGADYWIGKNSWGTDWGLGGFFLIERNPNNFNSSGACMIASKAVYPIAL